MYTQKIAIFLLLLDHIIKGIIFIVMLSHGKLDLSYFFGGAENCVDLLHLSVAEIAEEIICYEFLRNMFVYLQTHLLMQVIASANKQLLSVVM